MSDQVRDLRVLGTAAGVTAFLGLVAVVAGLSYGLAGISLLAFFLFFATGVTVLFLITPLTQREIAQAHKAEEGKEPTEAKEPESRELQQGLERYLALYQPLLLAAGAVVFFLFSLASVTGSYFIKDLFWWIRSAEAHILAGISGVLLSFVFMVAANWFAAFFKRPEAGLISTLLKALQVIAFAAGVGGIFFVLGFPWVDALLSWLLFILVGFIMAEMAVRAGMTLALEGEEKEYSLALSWQLLTGKNPLAMLLDGLENSTGISLRSSWTIGFIRKTLPLLGLLSVLFFWLMTSLVQINPQEQGLVYRFGRLQTDLPLSPGLHLKAPWPIDSVRVFPVFKVQSFSVGYERPEEVKDYLWTRGHGGEEYKLLLGNGNELVSINMIVYYEIADVVAFSRSAQDPVEELKGHAYRQLLAEIVATDLDSLLTRDRSSFARDFAAGLQAPAGALGLRVLDVALTSIHPPVEIAREYQEIISAGTQKQIIINRALADAKYEVIMGEVLRAEKVSQAQVEAILRLAQVQGEIGIYVYQQKAYLINPALYRQWKWLEALEAALPGKFIYLLGENTTLNSDGLWLDFRNSRVRGVTNE
jgi:regulator of protease activity HflC (stomatin/prohibitin superfamily)/predicted secreted protein